MFYGNKKRMVDEKQAFRFSLYCEKVYSTSPPAAYTRLQSLVKAYYGKIGEVVESGAAPQTSPYFKPHHVLSGILTGVNGHLSVGDVGKVWQILKLAIVSPRVEITIPDRDAGQDVTAMLRELVGWIETTFAEENLPAEFRGKGLGLTVNAAEPASPPSAAPEP